MAQIVYYESGAQMRNKMLFTYKGMKEDEAYRFVRKVKGNVKVKLMTPEQLEAKRAEWEPYSQWWTSPYEKWEIQGSTVTHQYHNCAGGWVNA